MPLIVTSWVRDPTWRSLTLGVARVRVYWIRGNLRLAPYEPEQKFTLCSNPTHRSPGASGVGLDLSRYRKTAIQKHKKIKAKKWYSMLCSVYTLEFHMARLMLGLGHRPKLATLTQGVARLRIYRSRGNLRLAPYEPEQKFTLCSNTHTSLSRCFGGWFGSLAL